MSMPGKITNADLNGKGVTGLPDTPGLSTAAMQAKFDELSLDILVPKVNALIDALNTDLANIYTKAQVDSITDELDDDITALSGKVEPNFSTTEQSTGKKWIDSRTIYKKTYSATNISPSGGYYTIGQLTGFREIVKIDGVMYYGGNYISAIPAISSDGYIGVSDEGEIGAIPKWTTTIYYTKN